MSLSLAVNKKYTALYNYSDGTPYIDAGWSASYGTNPSIQVNLIRATGSQYAPQASNVLTYIKIWRTNDDCDLSLAKAAFKAYRYTSAKNGAFPESFFDSDNDTAPHMPSGYTDVSTSLQISKTGNVIEIYFPSDNSSTRGTVIPISLGMLNALIKEQPKYSYSMDNTLANCTLIGTGVGDGEYKDLTSLPELTATVTADEGYTFINAAIPTLQYTDANGDTQIENFTIETAGEQNSASITFTPIDGTEYRIFADAAVFTPVAQTYYIETSLQHAVMSGSETGAITVYDIEEITLRVDANEGYEFTSSNIPTIEFVDSEGIEITNRFTIDGQSDNRTAFYTFLPIADIHYRIVATATETAENDKYNGLATIYNATKADLTRIANTRYINGSDFSKTVDLGDYITGIWEYPFTVIGNNPCEMVLGGYTTGIHTTYLTNPNVTIEFKPVILPVLAGDYECKIWVPFSGFHTLNYDYIKGSEIGLVYNVDMYNADCMISVLNNGTLIEEYTGKVARSIPYKTYQNNITTQMQGSYNGNTGLLNNLIPFIVISQTNTNQFKFTMTKDEYDELVQLLKEGVIYG